MLSLLHTFILVRKTLIFALIIALLATVSLTVPGARPVTAASAPVTVGLPALDIAGSAPGGTPIDTHQLATIGVIPAKLDAAGATFSITVKHLNANQNSGMMLVNDVSYWAAFFAKDTTSFQGAMFQDYNAAAGGNWCWNAWVLITSSGAGNQCGANTGHIPNPLYGSNSTLLITLQADGTGTLTLQHLDYQSNAVWQTDTFPITSPATQTGGGGGFDPNGTYYPYIYLNLFASGPSQSMSAISYAVSNATLTATCGAIVGVSACVSSAPSSAAVFPTPQPIPLCADLNGATNPVIRATIPLGTVPGGYVYCRILAQNRTVHYRTGTDRQQYADQSGCHSCG